jgi:hypothetical protein
MQLPPPSHSRKSRLAILPALALFAASVISACSRASSNTLAIEIADGARLSKTLFTEKLGAYLVYSLARSTYRVRVINLPCEVSGAFVLPFLRRLFPDRRCRPAYSSS